MGTTILSFDRVRLESVQPFARCNTFDRVCLQLISYNFSANVANFVPNFVVKFKSS